MPDEGFCRSRERLRNDGSPMRAEQGFGRSRRPLSKVEFREDLGGLQNQPQQSDRRENEPRGQPSRAYASLIQESLLEEANARRWIEDRRRPAAEVPVENDGRFSGVLGQASREPRPDTRAGPTEDRLGKVVDVMERALANLNERITALENNSIRSGRDRSPELWPERKEEYIVVPERYSEHDKAPRGLAGQRSGQPFDDSYLQNNVTIVDPSKGIRDRRRDQPYPQNSMNEQFVRGSPYLYPPEIYAKDDGNSNRRGVWYTGVTEASTR